jgi:hypothetical protein
MASFEHELEEEDGSTSYPALGVELLMCHFGYNENKLVIYTKNMMPMHGGLIKFSLSCLC